MRLIFIFFLLIIYSTISFASSQPDTIKTIKHIAGRPSSIGVIGDTANVNTPVKGGIAMVGGGKDVDAAFKWMINRSGGGDVVVIRASGTDAYNPYIKAL